MDYVSRVPRTNMGPIARVLGQLLSERKAGGPEEPSLDVFADELTDVADRLDTQVTGKTLAVAARATRLVHLHVGVDNVSTYYRHIESYLSIEGHRKSGAHVADALALHKAVCPDGLSPLDEHVTQQTSQCRSSLNVLRAPEHAAVIASIGLPVAWVDAFEAALDASEAAQKEVVDARTEGHMHVELGRDAEVDWHDMIRRLRRQMASRSRRGGAAKKAEGLKLMEPLLVELQRLAAEYAGRKRRKDKKAPTGAPPASPALPAPPQAATSHGAAMLHGGEVTPPVTASARKELASLKSAPPAGEEVAPPAAAPPGSEEVAPPAAAPPAGNEVAPQAAAPPAGKDVAAPAAAPPAGKEVPPPATAASQL